ncbi:hypothetical protein ACIQV3_36135 [Streptomyces sp. NPDC099050]|uniref:hypothetical protein n=1 Tax=Streptomyces sp. NPDC099050 TaxID=3366100 RepID=UPI00380E705B
MTSFVITVPGTFVSDVADSVRFVVERKLASRHTEVSENEGLRLLAVNDDGTFSIRLEVEAPDKYEAELDAMRIVTAALKEAGLSESEAPLGPPAVTGIDSGL